MSYPLLVKSDLDGFFALFIDNLIQLILIGYLCTHVCQFPYELTFGRILPACALSIFFGNILYSYQAWKLAQKEGRSDVCALPYGINTVSLFAFIFFIILPVYRFTEDPYLAWRFGVFACFVSALIEIVGSFLGSWIRKITPRAALLAALAGIAITFISMDFAFKIFANPILTFLPLFIILMSFFSGKKLFFGVPGGLFAITVGTIIAWLNNNMSYAAVQLAAEQVQLSLPSLALDELWGVIKSSHALNYLAIIIPMGIFNVVGSLQNIESAAADGDSYPTRSSLMINGLGSLSAACLGSCFPTTIYIGHPGWKELGSRCGYSTLNGLAVMFLCLSGSVGLISTLIPMDVGIGILLWIGVVIMAQAFQAIPPKHAPAVAIGLIPVLAGWALLIIQGTLSTVGSSLNQIGLDETIQSYSLRGIIALSQGFIFTSIIWSAITVYLIESKFLKAVYWTLAAAILSFFGVLHCFQVDGNDVLNQFGWAVGYPYALGYSAGIAFFLLVWLYQMIRQSQNELLSQKRANNRDH